MEVGFHEPGLIFMKIHRKFFMRVYRIDPRCELFSAKQGKVSIKHVFTMVCETRPCEKLIFSRRNVSLKYRY